MAAVQLDTPMGDDGDRSPSDLGEIRSSVGGAMDTESAPDPGDEQPALRAVTPPAPLPTKLCPNGHPSNPNSGSCMDCQHEFQGAAEIINMAQRPVAKLLLEDGTAVDIADDLVIGRSPIGDDLLDTLTVTGRQVSRRHLLLKTKGWELQVQDCDSTNGTFVSRRGERGRRRVTTDDPMPIRIGDSLHFGSRQALVVRAR